jgi:hypothetical protein
LEFDFDDEYDQIEEFREEVKRQKRFNESNLKKITRQKYWLPFLIFGPPAFLNLKRGGSLWSLEALKMQDVVMCVLLAAFFVISMLLRIEILLVAKIQDDDLSKMIDRNSR